VEKGEDGIFRDPMSESMAEGCRSGVAKALERENAALVQAGPFGSMSKGDNKKETKQ
jgi:hypothetical protein